MAKKRRMRKTNAANIEVQETVIAKPLGKKPKPAKIIEEPVIANTQNSKTKTKKKTLFGS
jgi:hypothetical protein